MYSSVIYDGDGSPINYPVNTTGTLQTLVHDQEDRMTNIPSAFTMGYYPDGRRAWKMTGGVKYYYVYDGDSVLYELNGSGTATNLFGYGAAGLSQRRVPSTSTTYHYSFDPSGNVVQRHQATTVNISGGPLLADFTTIYDGFGQQLGSIASNTGAQSGAAGSEMIGFAGQFGCWTDNETSMNSTFGAPLRRFPWVWMGHREYDPTACRFLTRDPIGYDGGINLYAYAENNPIMNVDPSGLSTDPGGANDTVRIVVAAFIPNKTAKVGPLTFLGDNRGFSSTNNRFRTQQQIILSPNQPIGKRVQVNNMCGLTTCIGVHGINWTGRADTDMLEFHEYNHDELYADLQLDNGVSDPFLFSGLGQAPSINYHLNIGIYNDGKIQVSGTVADFPSIEIYAYKNSWKQPRLVWSYSATKDPLDIFKSHKISPAKSNLNVRFGKSIKP